ncbi:MAG: hypothetical protein CMB11_08380 [Euryarchaeota archaeon]|nr:hypothetical protein [Euryarchaeota archaeon]
MNNADIVGIVCIALGLLLILAALYATPWFLIVSGIVVAIGAVMIITGGSVCRSMYDDDAIAEEDAETPNGGVSKLEERGTSRTLEPPLTRVAL